MKKGNFISNWKVGLVVLIGTVTFIVNGIASGKTAKDYIEDLRSKDERVVNGALEYLGETEESYDETLVPCLIEALLHDKNATVRRYAANSLAPRRDNKVIPALIEALKDKNEKVRSRASGAIGYSARYVSREKAKVAIPALIKALKDNDKGVRIDASRALGNIGDKAVIPELIETFKDNDKYVRSSVVLALGYIGDKSAVPVLIEALKDKEGNVRKWAVNALGKIEDPSTIPDIEKLAVEDPYTEEIDAGTRGGKKGEKIKIYPVREEAEKVLKQLEAKKKAMEEGKNQ